VAGMWREQDATNQTLKTKEVWVTENETNNCENKNKDKTSDNESEIYHFSCRSAHVAKWCGCGVFLWAADFFQLLFVCLQWRAFRLESRARKHEDDEGATKFDGGSNVCILKDIENDPCQNPYDDFLSYKKLVTAVE